MSDQEEPAEQQAQAERRYGVQLLAEQCPRAASLYFFGFGIWTVLVCIVFLFASLGMISDGIPHRLFTAGVACFSAAGMALSLLALWDRLSRAKRRAPSAKPATPPQEAPAERPVQRFAVRYPRLASVQLYGYGICAAVCLVVPGVFTFLGGTSPLRASFFAPVHLCFMLLSVPVAILAFRCLRRT